MGIPYPYPKIASLERAKSDLERVTTELITQEKFDGSNVSVVITAAGNVAYYSRNTQIDPNKPESFHKFVEYVNSLNLSMGFRDIASRYSPGKDVAFDAVILYGEMLGMGKINYPDKLPFILFDIAFIIGDEIGYLPPRYLEDVANHSFGKPIPHAKVFWTTGVNDLPQPLTDSRMFPGTAAEGYVVKAYNASERYTNAAGETHERFVPILAAKVVNESYKETTNVKKEQADPIQAIGESLVTPARIEKARGRIRERGGALNNKGDIIQEVLKDIRIEDEVLMKQRLFDAYSKKVTSFSAKEVIRLLDEEHNNVGATV